MEILVMVAIAVVMLVTYIGFNPREPPPKKIELTPLLRDTKGIMQVVQLDLDPVPEDEWFDFESGYDIDKIDFKVSDDSNSDEI